MNKFSVWLGQLWDRLIENYFGNFDVREWALNVRVVINSLLILLVAWIAIKIVKFLIRRFERRVAHIHGVAYRQRIDTVVSLSFSSVKYAIYIACTATILAQWGVSTDSLLLGTAVLGAALGFGAQGIVQDVITGLSMLAEDQLSVGDFVEIAGKTGAVEEVGLRVVKIRDASGAQHVIFNRMINMVSNFTGGAVQAYVDIALDAEQDKDKAVAMAEKVCQDIAGELPHFPRAPLVEGVHNSSTGDMFLRIDAVVLPGQETVLRSHFIDRIRSVFAANEIKIPNDKIRVLIASDLFSQALERGKMSGVTAAAKNS